MKKVFVCTQCGDVPLVRHRGNGLIELLLWLFFIIPGIIYSSWRGKQICAQCKGDYLVPGNSPRGKKIIEEIPPEEYKEKAKKQEKQRIRSNVYKLIAAIIIVAFFFKIFS